VHKIGSVERLSVEMVTITSNWQILLFGTEDVYTLS